jgi:hypothetical protein
MIATLVHTGDLVKSVIASLVAGVGITFVFSVAIWGGARFVDLSRDGRRLAAGTAAVLGGLALASTLAAVAIGIVVMTSK